MAISQIKRVVTSSVIPKSLRNRFQNVPFMELFPDRTNYGKPSDTFLYIPVENSTQIMASVGQQWKMAAPVKFGNTQMSTPVYTITARAEHKIEDEEQYAVVMPGQSLVETELDYMKASTFQRVHYGAWFGFSAADNQGLYTASLKVVMPADSKGNTTVIAYDPVEFFRFLVDQARQMMNVTFNEAKPVLMFSSNRIINYINSTVMSLVESQLPGAGVDSVAGTYARVVGDWLKAGKMKMIADDLLKGTGTGSKDIINLTAPGLSPEEYEEYSNEYPQNIVGESDMKANTLLNANMPFTVKPNPESDFTVVRNSIMKTTPGTLLRYEASRSIEATYE